jgi:uncharacterized protein YecE (DUF72 family)
MLHAASSTNVSSAAGKQPGSTETLYAGTSGFSYSTWKGNFYPPTLAGTKMLAYYAERLNGVELNGSFYHTPPESTLLKWSSETPPEFRFCMKANRGLTYSAEGFDRVGLARILGERVTPLGERLGPIFLQFPPVRQKNVPLLDSLLGALARPAAVEFRHVSWFDDETYRVLREHNAALVITDEEKWPRAPKVEIGSTAYFRLRRGYTRASLRPWLAELRSALAAHDDVHVYFKHDPESPALAQRILALAGTGSAPRPAR